ncbi:MAG: McrC family protein [Sulfurimonas sp.]|jgi:5-methylcytosine-specific restriction enzyme subunit McrC
MAILKTHITLSEFSYIFIGKEDIGSNQAVDEKTFREIESFVLQNSDTVQYLKLGQNKLHKYLQAQNYVGVIQTKSGVTIEILPKIARNTDDNKSKKIMINMLKTLKKSPFKSFNMADLKSTNLPLLEIFITMFLVELEKLIQKGIKSDYIYKEENLGFLKGKLNIKEHMKHNYVHKERFYVQYQEFIQDRVENRLIKTTLEYLYQKSKANSNKKRIREFLFVFDDIKTSHNVKEDFKKVRIDRQMNDYELVLQWAKIFLYSNSFSPYKGNDVAFALLFDMNLLFESYVGYMLRKKGLEVALQDREHHLAYLESYEGKFQLKPDIIIKHEDEVIIADTKWKLLNEDKTHQGVSQSDMYQLYAYGTKYTNPKCENMYLIYPKNEDNLLEQQYHYEKDLDGLKLKVLFFDLENPDEEAFYANFKIFNKSPQQLIPYSPHSASYTATSY